jgi:S1-C subfamily serine protease
MFRHSFAVTSLAFGLLSEVLMQPPQGIEIAWAAAAPAKPEAQAHPSSGTEVSMPEGVIGVSLHVGAEHVGDKAVLYIAHVLPEGPAQQAGLKQGDEIMTVDGMATAGKTYEQVALLVRGEPGSVVKLVVKREGEEREISVTRVAGQSVYKGPMGSHGGSTK